MTNQVIVKQDDVGLVHLSMPTKEAVAVMFFIGACYHEEVKQAVLDNYGSESLAILEEQSLAFDTFDALSAHFFG